MIPLCMCNQHAIDRLCVNDQASSKDLRFIIWTLYLINVFCAYNTVYQIKRIVSFQINCSFVPMLTMFQRRVVSKTFVTDWTLWPRQQQWKSRPQPRPQPCPQPREDRVPRRVRICLVICFALTKLIKSFFFGAR